MTNDRRRQTIAVTDDRRAIDEDRIEVETSLGSVKASGSLVPLLVTIFIGFAAIVYMLSDHDRRQLGVLSEARAERLQQIKRIEDSQARIDDSMQAVIYVLSLSQEQRQKLNLDMPDGLRRKTGRAVP